MRITPTCAVIWVHYQQALVPNLDFGSGTALNKLCAPSHESHSPNTWQSFLFSIIHLRSRIIFHSPQLWHLCVWGQPSADGSRTDVCSCPQPSDGQVYSSLNYDSVWHLLPIRLHNHDQGHRQKLQNVLSGLEKAVCVCVCCFFVFLDFLCIISYEITKHLHDVRKGIFLIAIED